MPWTLGDVTAESVSSTSVDSTAVSANSITIQGSPVYAKRTIVITGMFNNIFSQTGGQDFLEWTSNTAPTSTIPTLLLPFDCTLVSFSCRWCADAPVVLNSAGDSWKIDIGRIADSAETNLANWTSLTGGAGLQTWDASDDGTHPSKISENLNVELSKGWSIGVIGFESSAITPSNGEAQVCMVFEM